MIEYLLMKTSNRFKTIRIMKLELKHLVGYLPYGLKWTLQEMKTFEMQGITPNTLYTKEGTVLRWEKHPDLPQALFPILRPLSDLTKEIEVNGEKFVPLTELLRLSNFDVEKMDYKEQLEFIDSFTNILFMTFDDGQKLLEWHFDIFGLIEKGLAISIHDLKNN